jgi:hypothetical protein
MDGTCLVIPKLSGLRHRVQMGPEFQTRFHSVHQMNSGNNPTTKAQGPRGQWAWNALETAAMRVTVHTPLARSRSPRGNPQKLRRACELKVTNPGQHSTGNLADSIRRPFPAEQDTGQHSQLPAGKPPSLL